MQIINRIEMRFGLKISDNQLVENKIGGGKNASLPHKTQTKRIFGLDLIRVFASLFTIAGHFFFAAHSVYGYAICGCFDVCARHGSDVFSWHTVFYAFEWVLAYK